MKRLTTLLVIIFSFLLFNSCCDTTCPEDSELFPDPNFEKVIRNALDKLEGEIAKEDLLSIFNLFNYGYQYPIYNISGIEYCKNLESMNLHYNKMENLSYIKDLQFLSSLNLAENKISNLNTLKGPKNLTYLNLSGNDLSDIRGIINTPNLRGLDLGYNSITDISHLKGMNRLQYLTLKVMKFPVLILSHYFPY